MGFRGRCLTSRPQRRARISTTAAQLTDDAGSVLEVIERPPGTSAPSTRYVCHAAFLVEDYDRTKAELVARGARFEADTEVLNESMRTGFFDDPQGNRVQIVWRALPLGE